jgi:hypothetical protein
MAEAIKATSYYLGWSYQFGDADLNARDSTDVPNSADPLWITASQKVQARARGAG